MRRREFFAAFGYALGFPVAGWAQKAPRRIGYLGSISASPLIRAAWRSGLRENGWIEGKNLIVEYHYVETPDRMATLVTELIALSPDLLIAGNPQAAVALKSATATIPIVFVAVFDPVGLGLVQSLSRPGGNITGLATFVPGAFIAKRIQILRDLVPTASKIAILVNPGNPMHKLVLEEVPSTVRELGVALPIIEATTPEELETAFASAAAQHADAIIVFADPLTNVQAPGVTALAAEHRLPAIYLFRQFADGGLIVYGPDIADLWHRAGGYVDKILKGTKPSDLPVEQPTKFKLVINLRTAKALGIDVPWQLQQLADEVVE